MQEIDADALAAASTDASGVSLGEGAMGLMLQVRGKFGLNDEALLARVVPVFNSIDSQVREALLSMDESVMWVSGVINVIISSHCARLAQVIS